MVRAAVDASAPPSDSEGQPLKINPFPRGEPAWNRSKTLIRNPSYSTLIFLLFRVSEDRDCGVRGTTDKDL